MPAEARAHVRLSGRVQGVGFRYATADAARRRQLGGWVRNLDSGGVEAVFEGVGSSRERILTQRSRRVGSSAVILTARGGSMPGSEPEINERWLDGSTLIGLETMGDDGNLIGRLVDASFDQDSLEIEAYLLHASPFERMVGRRGRIQPAKVHACS